MAIDVTAAAAASAAAGGASYYVHQAFGVPLDAIGCGLGGAFIGLFAVKAEVSNWRALGQFIGYGIGGAIVGNWASKEATTRELVALLVGIAGGPLVRVVLARAEEAAGIVFDRLKGGKQ
jgi:hypothetical protein